ncbi:hypothetical protein HY640_02870 [Candidatus Woesearchaeota archaeon]|nr:hypothetical protein [Candidatus Woesearchaeota archaeon]
MKSPERMRKPFLSRTALILAAALALLYLIAGYKLKIILAVAALIAIASMSTFYYNYFHGPISIELIKPATILSALAYDAVVGIIVGITSTLLSRLWTGRLDHRTLISLIGISAVAAIAQSIPITSLAVKGIVLVTAYHALTAPVSIWTGDRPSFVAVYAATNIIFNAAILLAFEPILSQALKAMQ